MILPYYYEQTKNDSPSKYEFVDEATESQRLTSIGF